MPVARPEPASGPPRSRAAPSVALITSVGIVLAGIVLRMLGARGDPWLDEIWSWSIAQRRENALAIFAFAHDNNHPLNTLWLRAVQGVNAAWVWRIPSLLFGAASLALVVALAWRRCRLEAMLAAALCCVSFLLVTYQSEARGYAGMLLATLVAWGACREHLERPSARWIALLAVASVLGVLSHPTWIQGWFALAGWTAWRCLRTDPRTMRRRWLALHAAPSVVVFAFTAGFLSRMVVGGGPTRPLDEILLETCALGLGAPLSRPWEIAAAVVVALVLAVDALEARRAGSDAWVATVLAVLVAPAAALILLRPEFVAPRYFLVPLLFWLLALARVSAGLWTRSPPARAFALVVVTAILAGNAARIVPFLRLGRGHYRDALAHVQQHTTAPSATLRSADDFDISLVLTYFRRTLPLQPTIDYLGRGRARDAEWYLLQSVEPDPVIEPSRRIDGVEYVFAGHFPYFGQSGAHWILYRRTR